jgi:ABC-2 type transport system permease protein
VLWAKLLVFSAVTFVLMLVSTLVSFYAVQAIVTQHHEQVTLGAPHALRAVVGTALFLTVLGVMATALGALVRNTAGGIATFVGLLFVLPGIVALLPASTGDAIGPYLPLNAAFTVATSTFDEGSHHLTAWTGFAVFCGYAAIAVVAAAVGLVRRDA